MVFPFAFSASRSAELLEVIGAKVETLNEEQKAAYEKLKERLSETALARMAMSRTVVDVYRCTNGRTLKLEKTKIL